MSNAYYITTPIYYVNDVPHIGHAYTTISADILARFKRLEGVSVKFLTGTDEHGQKVEKAAAAKGVSPQAFVDEVSGSFRDLIKTINATPDRFIRTTDPDHRKAAQALWLALQEKGYIYKSTYAGWYAVRDESYYSEDELVNGHAPTGAPVEWVEEPSYFFKLSALEKPLLDYYEAHPDFIMPESRRNEVIQFVKGGLRDLAISRSTFKWGIPVPGDEEHVMYVWVEALVNYITALGYPCVEEKPFKDFWSQTVHIMGKDIIRFHGVYWPALLMAAGLPLPRRIVGHGWWTNEGQKISKSLGNVIDPVELVDRFGADAVRYFLVRQIPFGNDGDFSMEAFTRRVNSDLANDFGNLAQRVLSFIQKHAEGKIPARGALTEEDQALLQGVKSVPAALKPLVDNQALSHICDVLWAQVGAANRYVDAQAPWGLRKTDPERMKTVLSVLVEVIRDLAILVSPIVPQGSSQICHQLGLPEDVPLSFKTLDTPLLAGADLPLPSPAFPRIDYSH